MLVAVLFTGCLMGSTLVASMPMEFYATKYDHVDVEAILNNRRMVNYYTTCLLGKGPCPPDGLEFKRVLPDALMTNCAKCTEKQKTVTLRTIKRLKKEYPKIWAQLQEKWDPEDKYVKVFEATYGDRWIESNETKPNFEIGNRFGDSDDATTTPPKTITMAPKTNTPPLVTKIMNPVTVSSVTTPSSLFTNKVETTKKKISTKTTKTPIVTTKSTTTTTIKPASSTTRFPPITLSPVPNIGASIQATVSLSTNIVGNIFRGIGALGTRVAATGANIAQVVVKNLSIPLS